jgi:hypothetical protein
MLSFCLFFGLLSLVGLSFIDLLFFSMAFIWHFALLTPGMKEKMLMNKQRFSFLNVIVRINYYLQLFIKIDRYSFGPAIVRAISPLVFMFFLIVVGGNGNLLFTILGSAAFEISYYCFLQKAISGLRDDRESEKEIPNAESFHE